MLMRLSGHSVMVHRFSIITFQKSFSVTASPENLKAKPITAIGSMAPEVCSEEKLGVRLQCTFYMRKTLISMQDVYNLQPSLSSCR
jgi:hypothetical protein